jgi:hypothetical protein
MNLSKLGEPILNGPAPSRNGVDCLTSFLARGLKESTAASLVVHEAAWSSPRATIHSA